jgi:hypothetical protein
MDADDHRARLLNDADWDLPASGSHDRDGVEGLLTITPRPPGASFVHHPDNAQGAS